MPRQCAFCGKKVQVGYQYTYRGLAKSKGGVGRKVTGKTKRKFAPNLQKVRASFGTVVKRVRVCTRCLRSGVIRKPGRRSAVEKRSAAERLPVQAPPPAEAQPAPPEELSGTGEAES